MKTRHQGTDTRHHPHVLGAHDQSGERAAHAHHGHDQMVADFRRRFWVSLILTGPVLLLAPMIQRALGLEEILAFPGDRFVQFGIATAVFFYGGWPFLKGMIGEVHNKRPGMMTLIALAITVAYSYSSAVVFGVAGEVFFWELATLVDIMLLGHWVEMRSVMGASNALAELVRLMPSEAHRVEEDGSVEDVPITELVPGDRVLVKPGEKIPTDGLILQGRSTINQAMLTGESKPVEKGEADLVIGGSVNGEAAFTFEVQKTGKDTYLSQVIELLRVAQESRSRSQDLANRAAMWLTIGAITVGVITFVTWLALEQGFNFALERMVTVMVIACPHALGLAVPLVVAVSTSLSASHGLLVRDRSAFERARELQVVVFDKTGTLTEGRFGVTDVIALGSLPEPEILRVAAGLESRSEHPIGEGIVHRAREQGLTIPSPQDFQAIPGKSAQARIEEHDVKVVSPGYLKEMGFEVDDSGVARITSQGKTVVFVLFDGSLVGAVGLADIIRDESRDALRRLKKMGIRSMMLTGDAEEVAAWVAEELDLDGYFAEVLPHEKSERIRELKEQGLVVGMTGDGVNDAPALVEADVGIAIGAGTDVAIESADIVLVRSDPRDVASIVTLARETYKKMKQNLWWATGYNVLAIPLAAGVLYKSGVVLSPAVGAVLMSLSTVIVAINARLLGRAGKMLDDEGTQSS